MATGTFHFSGGKVRSASSRRYVIARYSSYRASVGKNAWFVAGRSDNVASALKRAWVGDHVIDTSNGTVIQ